MPVPRDDVPPPTTPGHYGARPEPEPRWFRPSVLNVKLVYAGYLTSLAVPLAAIVAVFFAYKSRARGAPAWLVSHYTFQIRTFWLGLAANVVAVSLSFAGIGLLLFPLIAVWLVARSVNGILAVSHREPIKDPNVLLF